MESFTGLININSKGIYSGPVSSQLSQLRSLYPNLKDFNYQTLTKSPNPNLFEFNQQANPQQLPKSSSNQSQGQTPPVQKTASDAPKQNAKQAKSQQKRPDIGEKADEKIFKRSAYHVAIAYHIYLKGLYEQGITSGNLIDPTYKARLVKEQAGLGNEN
jgi:hypothetical protein